MLDPITAIVGGAIVIGLLKKKQADVLPPTVQPAPVQSPAPAGFDPGKAALDAAKAAAGAAAGAVPAAVTTAVTVAAQVVGSAVVAAGASLAASEGAGALDKLLAPEMDDRGGASNVVARVAGAPVFPAVFLTGLAIFKLIPVAVLFTGLAYSGVGLAIIVFVWFIAITIENLSALSFGQPGAFRELEMMRTVGANFVRLKMTGTLVPGLATTLKDPVTGATRTLTGEEVDRVAEQAGVGFATEINLIRYDTWLKDKAWGIGASRAAHAKYGRDRGYFVGYTDERGDLLVDMNHFPGIPVTGPIFNDDWLRAHVPAGEIITRTGQRRTIRFTTVVGPTPPPMLVKLGIQPIKTTTVSWRFEPVTYRADAQVERFFQLGRNLANAWVYCKWMGPENRGFQITTAKDGPSLPNTSDVKHATYGLEHGRFHGAIDVATGRLVQVMEGTRYVIDWKKGVVQ